MEKLPKTCVGGMGVVGSILGNTQKSEGFFLWGEINEVNQSWLQKCHLNTPQFSCSKNKIARLKQTNKHAAE